MSRGLVGMVGFMLLASQPPMAIQVFDRYVVQQGAADGTQSPQDQPPKDLDLEQPARIGV